MDFIVTFFRDILDGYLYTFVAIICFILICSCIGYLAEVSLNKKKQKEEYEESHATVATPTNQVPMQQSLEESVNPVPVLDSSTTNSVPQSVPSNPSIPVGGVPTNSISPTPSMPMNPGIPTVPNVGMNSVAQVPQAPPMPMGNLDPNSSVVNTVQNVNQQ